MFIEDGVSRNPENPFGKGIEANGISELEFTLGSDIANVVVVPVKDNFLIFSNTDEQKRKQRYSSVTLLLSDGVGQVGRVKIISGNPVGFKTAMEAGGFVEYQDFSEVSSVSSRLDVSSGLTFKISDRLYFDFLISQVVADVGLKHLLVLEDTNRGKGRKKITLMMVTDKLHKVLEMYPLTHIVRNPYSRYLPTDKDV